MSPSRWSQEILIRELAREISLTLLGSSQIFRSLYFKTEAVSRFWSFSDTEATKIGFQQNRGKMLGKIFWFTKYHGFLWAV